MSVPLSEKRIDLRFLWNYCCYLWNGFFMWNSQGDCAVNSYINWWKLLTFTWTNSSMKNVSAKVNILTLRFSYLESFLRMPWGSGRLLNVQFLLTAYLISVFSRNFPTNMNNLSGAAILIFTSYFRSSRPSAFYKISVFKNFAKFLGKSICRNLFSIKLQTFSLKFY